MKDISKAFEQDRKEMVHNQIARRGVKDQRVLDAMRKIPRHLFVPLEAREWAYSDSPLSIGQGQTISQPYIVAVMSELLKLKGEERVLEIGTGSAYQTAILCELAAQVYSMERIPSLAEGAQKRLTEMGYRNVAIYTGDGTIGMADHAPYDGILVTAAAPHVPPNLLAQLADGGRLVIPVGAHYSQVLQVWKREGEDYQTEDCMGVVFVPLIGENGWANQT